MAKKKGNADNVVPFGPKDAKPTSQIIDELFAHAHADDIWHDDDDEPIGPGVDIRVNLNINISSVKELEKVEPIIDRLVEKYGTGW